MKKIVFISALLFSNTAWAVPSKEDVINHYADIAEVIYEDSVITAKDLQKTIEKLINQPTEKNLQHARDAWKAARVPYQQSEVYRFGNAIVDDWEGKVNAWPLDEGLIDYVDAGYGEESDDNDFYTANIIANKKIDISGKTLDASKINAELINELHELDGVEANVASGYHAIEFLLWGQDLNGTEAGAGNRPATDYDVKNCTNGNCDRRADYLNAVTDLLIEDLGWMQKQWKKKGEARTALLNNADAGIAAIFTGMGSLSYGELAGERMKLGVMLHDPEEEHDCFSDNTHNSHYYDALGVKNIYTGNYVRANGKAVSGPNLSQLIEAKNPASDKMLRQHLDVTLQKMQVLVDSAEKQGVAYDQMLAAENKEGNAKIMAAVDALLKQTQAIEEAMKSLEIKSVSFEGSDSLDNPDSIE
ncbi:MAG: imelysin family protein [Pseudomonadota bacterium]